MVDQPRVLGACTLRYTNAELQSRHIQVPISSIEEQTGFDFSAIRPFDAVGGLEATRQVRIIAKPDDIVI